MKVLVDISEEMFKATQTYYSDNTTRLSIKSCIEKIANGTPIPDNATNGDIIKAVFPNMEREHDVSFGGWMESNWIECDGENITHNEWWDAPYKRGGENGSN